MDRDRPSRRHVANANANPRSKHRQSLSLSIRTANHPTPPAIQQASTPPSQPYPVYPLKIPKDKEARALELYILYCDAYLKEKVENSHLEPQSAASHHDGYHLNVPGPPTAHSVTSYASSRHSLTSTYEAITDLSSVVSFDDEDEPTSAAAKAEGELMSFDGKKIKQRRRKKLNPVARAKAALVRHLVSCWVCRSRRVKCPLEHHDIDLLERLRQERLEAQLPRGDHNSSSSISSSSQQTATSLSRWPKSEPGVSQNNALMGIGENPDISQALGDLGNLDTTQLDIQSPGSEAYGDLLLDIPAPATLLHVATDLPDFSPNPYTSYQDGQMIAIGVQRDQYFYCQHLDGLCNEYFSTPEQLQTHFELAHFPFTRINPAHRYMCSSCVHLNNDIIGPCSNCLSMGTIELWIYGNFIRIPSFQRHAPDAQDVANFSPTTLFSNVSYSFSNAGDENWGQGGNYGGYTNTGGYGFGGGGGSGNAFGGSQYGYQPSNHSSYSTNHFQGSMFDGARQQAKGQFSVHALYGKVQDAPQHHKQLAFLFAILLAVVILGFTHDWIFAKVRQAIPRLATEFRAHSPLMGFLAMVSSFGTCLSVKQMAAQRLRHTRLKSQPPLHSLTKSPFPLKCGQTAPATFVLGGRFS